MIMMMDLKRRAVRMRGGWSEEIMLQVTCERFISRRPVTYLALSLLRFDNTPRQ
jgi:hypothetical protein